MFFVPARKYSLHTHAIWVSITRASILPSRSIDVDNIVRATAKITHIVSINIRNSRCIIMDNVTQFSNSPELYCVYCWYCGWKLCIASVMMSFGFIVSWRELKEKKKRSCYHRYHIPELLRGYLTFKLLLILCMVTLRPLESVTQPAA